MIICPSCKEEIEDDSHFCDQCGHIMTFCRDCGRVGNGRRCTYCGGVMINAKAIEKDSTIREHIEATRANSVRSLLPKLFLSNPNIGMNIEVVNGTIIGRRQGPYMKFFEKNGYVSGVHAQLMYTNNNGWFVVDKHSSNGTFVNKTRVHPDVAMTLKSGDILTIANVNLQIEIRK